MKTLHILAHLGGGVGKFLSDFILEENLKDSPLVHSVLMLERPVDGKFSEKIERVANVSIFSGDYSVLSEADVLVVHWWHHPLMAGFLSEFPRIKTRLIIMAHVSGCTYPHISIEFVKCAQKMIFATEFSCENQLWSEAEREFSKAHTSVVYGLGRLFNEKLLFKKCDGEFVVGYVGTISKAKLHPLFPDFCAAVLKKLPHAKFVLVGDIKGGDWILKRAKELNIVEKIELVGRTDDVFYELSKFHVFCALLNPYHFGATENAILEPLSAGLAVVCLNQCAEKYLVQHEETGMLANNLEDFGNIIVDMYENPKKRKKLGENAFIQAKMKFSFENNALKFRSCISDVLTMEKKMFEFQSVFGTKPFEWFLSCLGEDFLLFKESLKNKLDKEIISDIKNCKDILRGETKSSVFHFAKYYASDENLRFWSKTLK